MRWISIELNMREVVHIQNVHEIMPIENVTRSSVVCAKVS